MTHIVEIIAKAVEKWGGGTVTCRCGCDNDFYPTVPDKEEIQAWLNEQDNECASY